MESSPGGRTNEHTFRVRWGETDAFGIVFYPAFYAWMDQATHELFRTPQTTFADLFEAAGYGFPIVEASCRFSAPARYDDLLDVTSTVTEARNRTFRIDHTFDCAGRRLAAGYEVRAFARSHPDDRGRLAADPIPPALRGFLEGVSETSL